MAKMPNLGAEMPTLTGNANPLAAGMAMNAPQPQVPQPPVETFNAATMGAPNFDEPFIIPQAAQAFGDVPVNMPSNPLDPNPQISAPFQRAEQPVDPRGFMERMADATRSDPAPSVGTGKPSPFGGGTAMRSGAEGANTVFKDTIQSAIPLGLPGALPFEAAAPVADVSPTQIAPAADVNAGQEQVTLSGTPTSGSGIGTSVVNDVNFLQEGLKQAQAPQPQELTTAGGQPLAEFLAGGQQLDAQGRMIDPNVDRSSFEQESMLRDQRQEKMLQDRAQSRQDQRGGATGELSMADAVDMAGGDRDKARALVLASRQGAGAVSAKEQAETDKIKAETLGILEQIGNKGTELNLSPAETARDKTAGTALAKWDDSGRATVTSNITALDNIVGGLEDGQIKTRGFIDALPFGSDWARAIMNPEAADAKNRVEGVIFQTLKETLGAQFTEREGKRLVEASYNPMLDPATNAARLRDYSNGLKKAVQARESQMAYLKENKTLQGYNGATPAGVMSQVGSGEGGSPIQGDIDDKSLDGALL